MRDGKAVGYIPQRFMFQWKSEQIKFGKGGYFDDLTLPLDPNRIYSSIDTFWAMNAFTIAHFTEGRFRYATVSNCKMPCGMDEAAFLVADCSSFAE